MTNTVIFIIGMHRSGTSLVSRLCNLLGVELGDKLAKALPGEHETDYWEHEDVIQINEDIFKTLGFETSDEVRPLPENWWQQDNMAPFQKRIAAFISNNFASIPLWGIKDPRLCRLFPLWHTALNQNDLNIKCIIPFRHPLEVAASLHKRNPHIYDTERSLNWWLMNVQEAELYTRNLDRVFIYYPDLLDDWQSTMERVTNTLNVTWPNAPVTITKKVSSFLNPSLRHHAYDEEDLPPEIVKIFHAMRTMSHNTA